jgi:metacaspase-1
MLVTRRSFLLVAASCIAGSGCRANNAVAAAKGIAVCIGLNTVDPDHYRSGGGGRWETVLTGAENDAREMHRIAQDNGFDITGSPLVGQNANRKAVTGAIEVAQKKLVAGDIFMITFSGHGGSVPDNSGDDGDGLDETWCLFDGQMRDDALWHKWSGFQAGVRILVISDSCHSGTVIKGADRAAMYRAHLQARRIQPNEDASKRRLQRESIQEYRKGAKCLPSEVARQTYIQNVNDYIKWAAGIPDPRTVNVTASVLLLAACKPDQLAGDWQPNSVYTGDLLHVWNNGKWPGSAYSPFQTAVRDRINSQQQIPPDPQNEGVPNAMFMAQRPFKIN